MKYLSVATLVAFSCFLFSACSEEPDLSIYTDKIAELQSQLDSLKAGSSSNSGAGNGGSSITLSSGLKGEEASLNEELDSLQAMLEKVKKEHQAVIKVKEDAIKNYDNEIVLLAQTNSEAKDILDKRRELEAKRAEEAEELNKYKADSKLQEEKMQAQIDALNTEFSQVAEEFYGKEAQIAELKEAIKSEEEKQKVVIEFKMPYVGILRINKTVEEEFTKYNVAYDNGTEVNITEYKNGAYEEEKLMYNLAFGNGIEWVKHHFIRNSDKLLEYELKEYMDKNKALYKGNNEGFYAVMKKFSFEGKLDEAKNEHIEANTKSVKGTPDDILINVYKGSASGKTENISSLVVDITLSKNETGIWEKTVREAFFKYSGETTVEDSSYGSGECKEYKVTLGSGVIDGIPLWNPSDKPCYYK